VRNPPLQNTPPQGPIHNNNGPTRAGDVRNPRDRDNWNNNNRDNNRDNGRRYQQWADQYRRQREQQDRYARDWQRRLEQQRRRNQLQWQIRYLERLRQDQLRLQSWNYNNSYYNNDYRYYRDNNYYYTSSYGAQQLQRAVNAGYSEGYDAGQADRQDGWEFNPEESYGYQDASYGYDGYYVENSEYQYYFREGFRRGYEDGYYGQYRYGRRSNGVVALVANVLEAIIRFDRD
jgi:hypothetical protein